MSNSISRLYAINKKIESLSQQLKELQDEKSSIEASITENVWIVHGRAQEPYGIWFVGTQVECVQYITSRNLKLRYPEELKYSIAQCVVDDGRYHSENAATVENTKPYHHERWQGAMKWLEENAK